MLIIVSAKPRISLVCLFMMSAKSPTAMASSAVTKPNVSTFAALAQMVIFSIIQINPFVYILLVLYMLFNAKYLVRQVIFVMSIGISTASLYPENTETALDFLGKSGVLCAEIFFNAECETFPDFVRELVRIKNYYGMKITSVHPFTSSFEAYLLFSDYKRRFEDGVNLYCRYSEIAAELGAGIVVLHGDRYVKSSPLSAQVYTERFLELDHAMRKNGAVLTQENVNNYRAGYPEFIQQMRQFSGDTVKFTLDIKQSVRAGYTPNIIMNAMGIENIAHVHLSDHNKGADCLLPTCGEYDFKGLFEKLCAGGYKGDCVVEVYKSAYENRKELIEKYKDLTHMCS